MLQISSNHRHPWCKNFWKIFLGLDLKKILTIAQFRMQLSLWFFALMLPYVTTLNNYVYIPNMQEKYMFFFFFWGKTFEKEEISHFDFCLNAKDNLNSEYLFVRFWMLHYFFLLSSNLSTVSLLTWHLKLQAIYVLFNNSFFLLLYGTIYESENNYCMDFGRLKKICLATCWPFADVKRW